MEPSSISIINKNNGQLTGESASALPIKLMGSFTWMQYILIGFVLALIVLTLMVITAKKQVLVVEVSGKSNEFQLLEIK